MKRVWTIVLGCILAPLSLHAQVGEVSVGVGQSGAVDAASAPRPQAQIAWSAQWPNSIGTYLGAGVPSADASATRWLGAGLWGAPGTSAAGSTRLSFPVGVFGAGYDAGGSRGWMAEGWAGPRLEQSAGPLGLHASITGRARTGPSYRRAALEAAAGATLGAGPVRVGTSLLGARSTTAWTPGAQGNLEVSAGLLSLQVQGEAWRSDAAWDLGGMASVSIGRGGWAITGGYERVPQHPAFADAERAGWFASLRIPTGARPSPVLPSLPARASGAVELRLESPAGSGPYRVAGDFTDWQPIPMSWDGAQWVARVSLAPGVYHYTFLDVSGRAFVPEAHPGRTEDGFGGVHAALIVSSAS